MPAAAMENDHNDTLKPEVENFHAQSIAILSGAPTVVYISIVAFFTFFYGTTHSAAWCWVFLCVGTSCAVVFLPNKRPGAPMFYVFLGLLCFVAAVFGTLAGHFNWNSHMAYDRSYDGQRLYSNVLPTEPALSHLDAGQIIFTGDSKINLDKAKGYKQDGSTYCLAPVYDNTPASKNKVEYFAAGVDCCKESGSFECDDYHNDKAHAGLVYLKFQDEDLLDEFRKASQSYATANGVQVSGDALFVKWVEDVEEAADSYQNAGIWFFIGTSLAFGVLCVMAAFAIHYSQREMKGGNGNGSTSPLIPKIF